MPPPPQHQMPPGGYPPMPPMPPMPMPPPVIMYPPPHRGGGGLARGIFFTLAMTIFGLSLTLNIYLLIYTGLFTGGGAGALDTTILRDGASTQTIAVIPIEGVITGETFERFDRWLRSIEKDQNVKAIVLDIDTPGGEVTASDQIYKRVLKLREDKKIPVVAMMGSLAASGGYYVACAAEHIVANPTTITGSIGVRLDRISLAGLGEKYGVEDTSLHSTGADYKTMGSLWKRPTPEENAYLTSLIDDSFLQFKKVVSTGRQLSAEEVNSLANGKAYTANQALPLKLIDNVGYGDDAYNKAASLAKLNNPRVVRYRSIPSFFEALGAESSARANPFSELKIDRSTLERLTAPRLVYLWNGY
jgi:protease-4